MYATDNAGVWHNLSTITGLKVSGSGSSWHITDISGTGFVGATTYTAQADAQAALDAFIGTQGEVTL